MGCIAAIQLELGVAGITYFYLQDAIAIRFGETFEKFAVQPGTQGAVLPVGASHGLVVLGSLVDGITGDKHRLGIFLCDDKPLIGAEGHDIAHSRRFDCSHSPSFRT